MEVTMKKLSVLFTTFAVAATLSLAGCANVVSSTPDLPVTHTVTFDANGGTAVASQTVEDNGLAISPTTTNGSHNLVGWYNGSVKYDFTSKVTSDLALTAKWTKTVDKKVKYSSSWNVTNTVKSVGYIVLDCTAQTFENYAVVNGVDDLRYSGTYSMTESSITFEITASPTESNVGASTTYTISGDAWKYSADPAMVGFGNKTVDTTTVKKTVLETEEVE
jgi:hypothetical protein